METIDEMEVKEDQIEAGDEWEETKEMIGTIEGTTGQVGFSTCGQGRHSSWHK